MKNGKIGFGLVGTGMAGDFHAKELGFVEGAELVAVCCRNEDNARRFAETHGAPRWHTDYRRLIENKDVDVVNVLVPTGLHAEVTVAASQAGKHVLVEKPLETNLEKADEMIRVCRANKTKLGVIFQMRFGDVAAKLKETIESGRLGRIILSDAIDKSSPNAWLLRLRGLEGNETARGRWLPDDPVHSHHRSIAVSDRAGAICGRKGRHPSPRHRGRGHRDGAGELRQWGHGGH